MFNLVLSFLVLLNISILVSFFNVSEAQLTPLKRSTIVQPIRGEDFWEYKHQILDTPKKQYEVINKNNLPATWLVRYDALKNPEVLSFLKSLNQRQELGVFLEITPTLTKDAGVRYNESANWHYPKSVLVVGYSPEDRIKMVDIVMEKFKKDFGRYPKSVGAWWIDAGTLTYLHDKYQVKANLDVADQFSTDQYQVWGQYWSTPFYPAKKNAIMPAQSKENKIGVVTTQWAVRDPFNAYGNGVGDSTYSVQVNDYVLHDLDINYFKKLIDIYPFVTVGLENDFAWDEFGKGYAEQLETLASYQKQGRMQILTMENYADYYQSAYPDVSPEVLIYADDPLGSGGKVVWYQNLNYRVGWFYGGLGSVIRDLRIYNDSSEEECLKVACNSLNMATNATKALDDVTFNTRWDIDEGRISGFNLNRSSGKVIISYKNQSDIPREIIFYPHDIEVNSHIQTVPGAILNIYTKYEAVDPISTRRLDTEVNLGKFISHLSFDLVKFIIFIILFIFIPGWVLTKRLLFSLPAGIALFGFLSFILGFLKIPWILWIIPVVSGLLLVKNGIPKFSKSKIGEFNLPLWILILIGTAVWGVTTFKSGLMFNYGFGYWGPNGHDAIWHLSLITQLQKSFPPENPIFAGETLSNYHFLYDLVIARSSTLLNIDIQNLLFRFFPILISLLIGLLSYKLIFSIAGFSSEKYKKLAAYLGVFFIYFGGSFGWIVSYFKSKTFGGESMFWSQQAISTQLNPPFAFSLVLLLTAVLLINEGIKNGALKSKRFLLITSLIIGVIVGFKAYAGVLLFLGLGLYALERLIFKKDFSILLLTVVSGLISAIIFLPNNSSSNSLFIFEPLWLVKTMVESPDRLGWMRFNLTIISGVWYKVIPALFIATVIFIVGNLGLRIFSFAALKSLVSQRILFWITLGGIFLSLTLIQKGTNWNTVQFFYYTAFVLSLFTGIGLCLIIKKLPKVIGFIVVFLTVLLTIPTTLDTLSQYTPVLPSAYLPKGEYEALNFLKQQPGGIVLSLDFNEKQKVRYTPPYPLAVYTSTAYVAAFSTHPSFVADSVNLDILGIDYKGRLNIQKDLFRNSAHLNQTLKKNNIKYIYILKNQNANLNESFLGIKKIFENADIYIYQVEE